MALPFSTDTIDSIPEAQRSLYKEANGKFVLDVDGYEEPTGLKSALAAERKRAADAEKNTRAWANLGKTPDEIQALLEAQRKSEEDRALKGGEFEKLKSQIVDAHKVELGKKDERIGALTKSLERRLIDADAVAAIAAAKGVPVLLLPQVRAQVKVVEEDGDFKVQVVDKAGNPRVNAKGEFLSIVDLVSEMRADPDFGRAFEASGTTGSGANPSGRVTGKTMTEVAFNALSPKAKAKAMADGFTVV